MKPYVKLPGVEHVDGTAINIEIEDFISSEAANPGSRSLAESFISRGKQEV